MDKSISSEEKLLKVIRKKNHDASGQLDKTDSNDGRNKGNEASKQQKKSANAISLFSKCMIVLSIGLVAYIVMKGFVIKRNETVQIGMTKDAREGKNIPEKTGEKQVPFSAYSAKFEQRDIFDTSFYKGDPVQVPPAPPAVSPVAGLSLVGVILDDQAQAIIEDSKNNQTLFLYAGDKVGDVMVEKVEEGKVILKYKDQEFELKN